MKILSFFVILTISTNLFALDGEQLSKAKKAALVEAEIIIDVNSIQAWESVLRGDEVEVLVQVVDDQSKKKSTLVYGCHLHGEEMACHEEGEEEDILSLAGESKFNDLEVAHKSALNKLEKTFKRLKIDFKALKSLKVWRHESKQKGDHEHGADVWTKAIYKFNGIEKVTFVQCHQHDGNAEYFCHYKKITTSEPKLQ